ncbi:glycosyltransferase family 2 protein [Aequorivita sp. SDUM287046]|uniref:Glycosyltransferase family 2 protein n=1 Tax=Aequorivita aurantiaca TaxID=3053356 RepID=A0ABT8DKD4_9FLAO|nr:glycosyltransferase family 2 protein [Aequorivita aurantiaca]MDN3725294.1 glycosyltransferase family 2 protein [Aequorivita aurantiaca]
MISVLITHYNRIEEVKSCLYAFKKLNIQNIEYVVSDDGSSIEYQNALKQLEIDKLVFSPSNKGLTFNINQGIKNCSGKYILYCQEDFIPKNELKDRLSEILKILDSGKADMVRLKANYKFPKLFRLSEHINLIPKFSWNNFYFNAYQYSDHPFIVNKSFFEIFGNYLENTSGAYGENEYAIRIMKSKAKIAIVDPYLFKDNNNAESVIEKTEFRKKRTVLKKFKLHKLLRAFRLHLEYLFYNPNKRGLLTIKNKRKN